MRHLLSTLLLLLALRCATATAQDTPLRHADRKQYAEALSEYESRHFAQAATMMRKVATRNPNSADPQFWLGMISVADGFKTAGIRRYFARCIAIAPDYPHALAHYYMALIHYTDGHYEQSSAELERYFELATGSDDRATLAVYEEASNYLYWSQFLAEAELNAVPFEPRRVVGASSTRDEMLPFLSPDGRDIYYLRNVPIKQERTFYARQLEPTAWRLYTSHRKDSLFDRGQELPPPFNGDNPEGGISITADGQELYYSIIHQQRGYANSDIYRVRRQGGHWSEPENLGQQINGASTWESQPCVSADGRILVFASDRAGGHGGIDLWLCRRLANGDWSRPENMGNKINTSGNEKMPFLAADGNTLYFLSDGWQGFGGYDIYFTTLSDRHGNRPTNLGLPLNTEGDETAICVSADGRTAYFAGRLPESRSTDILAFDLYPAARPEAMQVCHTNFDGRDTVLVLAERRTTTLCLSSRQSLPTIISVRARQLPAEVPLYDSIAPLDLGSNDALDALYTWMVDHPRVHLSIESPRAAEANAAVEGLRRRGLRAERLQQRSGSAIDQPRIRLL